MERQRLLFATCVLMALATVVCLSGCGPLHGYRVRTEVRLDDAKIEGVGSSIDLSPVTLGVGFRAGGKTTGEPIDKIKADWTDLAAAFDAAQLDESTPELSFVAGGTGSRYLLQREMVVAASAGDVWFGYVTNVGVLCTLWDQKSKQVVDRFSVFVTVPGEWRVGSSDGVLAHSIATYLGARVQGKELDTTVDP